MESFTELFNCCNRALKVAQNAQMLLYPAVSREPFNNALEEYFEESEYLMPFVNVVDFIALGVGNIKNLNPEQQQFFERYGRELREGLIRAGLTGQQLRFKLHEVDQSWLAFEQQGGIDNLSGFFKKSVIILKSLSGAIPAVGSALQELIDFILERLNDLKG